MEGRLTKMEIAGYIWKKDVVHKLIWKHSVTRDEVEEVFASHPRIQLSATKIEQKLVILDVASRSGQPQGLSLHQVTMKL